MTFLDGFWFQAGRVAMDLLGFLVVVMVLGIGALITAVWLEFREPGPKK